MKKLSFCFIAAIFLLTGCVSTKSYKAALEESAGRKTQLEQTQNELDNSKQENTRLKKEMEDSKAALEKEISSLKNQLQELSSKGIMTSKEIEALKQEKERLSASDKAKGDEIANLAKEKEYLNRELERLQIKAGEISSAKELELANIKSTYETLVKEMQNEIEQGDIKITQAVDRLSVNLVEKILFDSGKAEIKPEGLKILKRVGDILKGVSDKQIRIEGHTDNVPIGAKIRQKYPTNWELSTTRASNVVRYLQDTVGVDPKMLFAAGFSEYRPVALNKTEEGKAQNRRIEIVLLPKDIESVLEELKK
jgi:chemotaxis protein MotB